MHAISGLTAFLTSIARFEHNVVDNWSVSEFTLRSFFEQLGTNIDENDLDGFINYCYKSVWWKEEKVGAIGGLFISSLHKEKQMHKRNEIEILGHRFKDFHMPTESILTIVQTINNWTQNTTAKMSAYTNISIMTVLSEFGTRIFLIIRLNQKINMSYKT